MDALVNALPAPTALSRVFRSLKERIDRLVHRSAPGGMHDPEEEGDHDHRRHEHAEGDDDHRHSMVAVARHACEYCASVRQHPEHRLVRQILWATVNDEGDLVDGEEWLACATCGQPYYSLGRIAVRGFIP